MIIVKRGNRKIEHALKEYRKKVSRTGLHSEYREKQHFIKKSEKRRKQKLAAKYRNEKLRNEL